MLHNENIEKKYFIIPFLNAIYPLGPELKSFLLTHIKTCIFDKNEIISKAGDICDNLYFIKKGMVRGYFEIDSTDITTWVDLENEIFTSITGFFRNEISQENIQSLEKTYCDYLTFEDYKYCCDNFPEMLEINRILMEEYYIMAEQRVFLARIPNAGKRLDFFMDVSKPKIIDRIPKKYLASFLAMRPETLSRLMKERN